MSRFFGRDWERFRVISSPEEPPKAGSLTAVRSRAKDFADFAVASKPIP